MKLQNNGCCVENTDYTNQRSSLIKLINILVTKHNYKVSTLYLAVIYLDTIKLINAPRLDLNLQLLAVGCFLVAGKRVITIAKFNETLVNNLDRIGTSYSLEELKQYETTCLKVLQYQLNIYTAYDCLMFFLCSGIIFKNETQIDFINLEEVYNNCLKILNTFVYDHRSTGYSSIQIATSVIILTRELINLKTNYNFEEIYNTVDFSKCYEQLKR